MATEDGIHLANVATGGTVAQHTFAKFVGTVDHTVLQCGAGEAASAGIMQASASSGSGGTVMLLGVSFCVYGATVASGQALTANAAGKAVPAGSGDWINGWALEDGVANAAHLIVVTPPVLNGRTSFDVVLPARLVLAVLTTGTVWTYTAPFAGVLVAIAFSCDYSTTDTSAGVTIKPQIGSTPVIGGQITLTQANVVIGAEIKGTAITGANAFTAGQQLHLIASSLTAWTDGSGNVYLYVTES